MVDGMKVQQIRKSDHMVLFVVVNCVVHSHYGWTEKYEFASHAIPLSYPYYHFLEARHALC